MKFSGVNVERERESCSYMSVPVNASRAAVNNYFHCQTMGHLYSLRIDVLVVKSQKTEYDVLKFVVLSNQKSKTYLYFFFSFLFAP